MSDTDGEDRATKGGSAGSPKEAEHWERELVHRLAFSALKEQRRARRWNILLKGGFLLFLILVFFSSPFGFLGQQRVVTGKHTGLVELRGIIAPDSQASADRIAKGLRAAFESNNSKGVILRINSPGGSPVQSSYIYDEIQRLREEYPEKPLYAVVTDVCASGGYYAAAAADKIYADKSSVVGSIGVLMSGFGFTGLMDKMGVERRLLTAGENKAFLDPFSPMQEEHRQHMKKVLDTVHHQFIDAVKTGRGERLADDPRIFSGLVWTGEQGRELGLVDAFGSAGYVAREVIGAEKVVNYTPEDTLWEQFARGVGTALGEVVMRAIYRARGLDQMEIQ